MTQVNYSLNKSKITWGTGIYIILMCYMSAYIYMYIYIYIYIYT